MHETRGARTLGDEGKGDCGLVGARAESAVHERKECSIKLYNVFFASKT